MKLAVTAALLFASPAAFAQTAAPAPAPAPEAPATAPAAAAKFNLDTPVEHIVADPAGKAVLDTDLPGLTTHEAYEQFKGMSLHQLQGIAPEKLPGELLAKVEADLAKLK